MFERLYEVVLIKMYFKRNVRININLYNHRPESRRQLRCRGGACSSDIVAVISLGLDNRKEP